MEKYFRGEKLIDRVENIKFLLDWFEKLPKEILWIYGPKSSGKTTIIEYVVENELFEDFWKFKPKKNYWIRYMNLREYLISSYDSFIEAFVKPAPEKRKKTEEINARINIGIFEIEGKKLEEVRERKKDLFKVMAGELQEIAKDKRVILIIDEIQTLEEIYINGDRELLKEFLNFCVRLTKELHIAHVVILSSNTIFIDRIYNDAKLKLTGKFRKIGHLEYHTVKKWLETEKFKESEIELVWEYCGGAIPRINRVLSEKKIMKSKFNLQSYLKEEAFLAYTEIVNYLNRGKFSEKEIKIFDEIAFSILEKGYFVVRRNMEEYIGVIDKWAEREILFYDPLALKVVGNDRTYEKGMEILLKS